MFGTKTAEKTKHGITSFDYIDRKLDEAIRRTPKVNDAEKKKARSQSKTIVAGFPIYDADKEAQAIDKMIAAKNEAIKHFIDCRTEVRAKLNKLGVKPLAVVPTKAWVMICKQADLIVMQPNSDGQVTVSYEAIRDYGSADKLGDARKFKHTQFIKNLFPDRPTQGINLTLSLPTPPKDVAETLLKVQSIKLHVAAVPEAVDFVETNQEIWAFKTAKEDVDRAYQEWLRKDPIIFHEHGPATAIIAQFGDFPIEKQVVDAVVEADDLIPAKLGEAMVSHATYATMQSIPQGRFAPLTGSQSEAEYQRMVMDQHRAMIEAQRLGILNQSVGTSNTGGLAGLIGSNRGSNWMT